MEVEYITLIPKYYADRPIQGRVKPCNVERRRKKMTIITSEGHFACDIEGFGTKKNDTYRWSTPEEIAEYLAWVESQQPLSEARARVNKAFQAARDAAEAADESEDIATLHKLAEYLEGLPPVNTTGLVKDMIIFSRGGQTYTKLGWRKETDRDREKAEFAKIVGGMSQVVPLAPEVSAIEAGE